MASKEHKIYSLVKDIKKVLDEGVAGKDFDPAWSFGLWCEEIAINRLWSGSREKESKGVLRMSGLGNPCERKIWYTVNTPEDGLPLEAEARAKFFYGDMIEEFALLLVKLAGHDVSHEQEELDIKGIKGHLDCVIDGMVIDVKSASDYAFQKHKKNGLRGNDPYGYLEQVSSYLYALKDDPLVTFKRTAGFLVFNKLTGEMCLDLYDVGDYLDRKERRVEHLKKMVSEADPPKRGILPIPLGKGGNEVLTKTCGWCAFRDKCYPSLRVFEYSGRFGPEPKYFTTVAKTPNVKEII